MLPENIQKIISEVRLKHKTSIDFKAAVIAFLIDKFNLNEAQAEFCYKDSERWNNSSSNLYLGAERRAEFADKILEYQWAKKPTNI